MPSFVNIHLRTNKDETHSLLILMYERIKQWCSGELMLCQCCTCARNKCSGTGLQMIEHFCRYLAVVHLYSFIRLICQRVNPIRPSGAHITGQTR